jgi:hypothetical protein
LLSKRNRAILPVGTLKVGPFIKEKPDVLRGTLALMVFKTLDVLGPQHLYGIARRIESTRWWRCAMSSFYRLCLPSPAVAAGRKQLQSETRDWEQTAAIIARFSKINAEDLQ